MYHTKVNKKHIITLALFLASSFLYKTSYAQSQTLNIGDHAPSLVLNSSFNSIQSFTFPNQNTITLLYFWSSSVPKSKQNIYRYKRIYNKYSDIGFKTANGFDMISVALQSDKNTWQEDLNKYGLTTKFNNGIAIKGYGDMHIKEYKISSMPSSFLIDENGIIIAINPSVKTIIEILESKRNAEMSSDVQHQISGKIMFGNKSLEALTNQKISFLNGTDTIKSIVLDENGKFLLENINPSLSTTIVFSKNSKIESNQTVFLTSENGEIISNFTNTNFGYEYIILDVEMSYLKPHFELINYENDNSLRNLYSSDQLFHANELTLSKDAILKLSVVLNKLIDNPKTQLEIITHSDCNGDAKLNAANTLKQSNVILAFFTKMGINKSRLKSIGKGEAEPINKCIDGVKCTEEEYKVNRRTEFKFYPL